MAMKRCFILQTAVFQLQPPAAGRHVSSSYCSYSQVIEIDRDLASLNDAYTNDDPEESHDRRSSAEQEDRRHRAFLRELDAMIRLRSPHTVHVYGKITTSPGQLILVMELLVGGDLRMLLKSSNGPLPENQSCGIISDICTGMAFLHSNETVHGDLKSANVLLDGAGRAKVRTSCS